MQGPNLHNYDMTLLPVDMHGVSCSLPLQDSASSTDVINSQAAPPVIDMHAPPMHASTPDEG
jgi:hypothetical protein